MTNLKEEIKRLENYHKWWKFWNWGGLKKDRAKEMIETYQELIKIQESNKNGNKNKKKYKPSKIAKPLLMLEKALILL